MSDSSDEDSDWEALGRGFPDISRLSLKFQWDSFITDLQHGTSLTGALDRLQTLKAKWDALLVNMPSYREQGKVSDASHSAKDCCEGHGNNLGHGGKDKSHNEETTLTDPTVVTKIHSSTHPLYTNDLVIPMEKEYTDLTHWDSKFNQDEDALRSRIKQIRSLPDISPEQQASMIQTLMMKKPESTDQQLPISYTPQYNGAPPEPTDEDRENIYHAPGIKGCPHYQRNCKLLCNQCNKWVSCRFCHDEATTSHQFKRSATQWILCTSCFHAQPPGRRCTNCDIEFSIYYCPICVLYDNDETKDIYHCEKCGICRLGLGLGQDFFHCDQCDACLSIELLGNHKCIENSTRSNCPICHEYMFTSTMPVVYMDPCGHAIHQHCFDEYIKHSYKCPNCSVSVINMEREFRILDQEIQEYRLPEPYCNWKCRVQCNDCSAKSLVDYHILGLKCGHCGSYNTRQYQLIKPGEQSSERRGTVSSFNEQNNEQLQQLRDELLHSNFQREQVSVSQWALDQDRLRNMDDFLREIVESNTTASDDELSFASRIAKFISQQAPNSSTIPQLSKAFAQFLGSAHQGLSSSDEDDI